MFRNFFLTAWRNLLKNKVTTVLNISGLTLGIAICLLIGIWLQREISFDNFIPNGQSVYRLTNTFKSESESFSQAGSATGLGAQLPKHIPGIKSACRVFENSGKFKAGNNLFFESNGVQADSNFFHFFGFALVKGKANEVLQGPDEIVLTENTAVKYFGKENPMGKLVTMDGRFLMKVTGIAANPPVHSHIQFDYVLPYSHLRKLANEQWNFDIDNVWVGGWPFTYIRIADPKQRPVVEKQVNQVIAKFADKEWKENKMSYQYHLQPLGDIHLKSQLRYDSPNNGSMAQVKIFAVAGLLVLLLACINYINLTTAGAIKRARETAVRKVIGAQKAQLIRQFFLETFIACSIAVITAVTLLKLLLPAFSSWIGQSYSFPVTLTNVLVLLAFIITVSLLSGIYPAIVLSSFNPVSSLKGNLFNSYRGNLLRKSLVVFQFTISIALIASILLINRQMDYIKNKSLGYDGKAVINISYQGDEQVTRQYAALRNELLRNRYIHNVSRHSGTLTEGLGNGWIVTENLKGEEISTSLYQMNVDSSFFATYTMQLAAGRFFSAAFPADSTKAVIVNEAAVKTFGWQKAENAIGKRFGKGDNARYVVGVVKDFNFEPLHKPVEALLLRLVRDNTGQLSVKVDVSHSEEAISHIRKTWATMAPEVPLQFAFVDDNLQRRYGKEQKMQGLFYGFSVLSLLIACLGLFGLTRFIVERKVKEIGIRKVLGAGIGGIVKLVSKDFVLLVIIAAVIATPLAWYFMHSWLQDFAYHITITWWVFAFAGVVALMIALLTVSFEAIKAALRNPVVALRSE